VKSLAYVENLVSATLMLWQRDQGPAFEIFNYVDKPDLTSREIVDAIYVALGRKPPTFRIPWTIARVLAVPFDIATALTGKNLPISTFRIRKLAGDQTRFEAEKVRAAGFRPEVQLRDGIARMVDWYLREGHAQGPSGPNDAPSHAPSGGGSRGETGEG
jgi:nucleoside-diphosphate-sugar epimerase